MFQKSLHPLCPAESSEVSTREKEGTPRLTPRGDISHPVLPRRVSAEGPLASLGATKKGLGATKKRLGTVTQGETSRFA